MRSWTAIFSVGILTLVVHGPRAGAQQIRDGLILLYEFEEGTGDAVTDSSGFGDPFDLTIQDPANTSWGNGFLTISSPTIITNPAPPQKIFDAVIPVDEFSVEAWVTPQNATLTGPARLFNISNPDNSPSDRNLTLGQDGDDIQGRLRTDTSTINGAPYVNTSFSGPVITEPTELKHIIYTRDPSGASTIYVDGEALTDPAATQPGDTSAWVQSYRLSLAHEFDDPSSDNRSWRGDYHLVAMWNRALSEAEVTQRFGDGPVAPGGMPLVAGDVNGDGNVDLDDYGIIRDNFLNTVDGRAQGDLNFDRLVDWTDFRQWKTEFQAAGGNPAAIPEPSTAGLILLAAGMLLFARHRRGA